MTVLPLSLRSRRVFVDSGAYLALLDSEDEHHDQASVILRNLARARYRSFTTNTVIIESHALLLSHMGIAQADQFLTGIEESTTTIIRVRAGDEERAKQIVHRHTDKDYSLTDAISFVVMERLGISLAFAFDRHFAQYGLTTLTPEWFE